MADILSRIHFQAALLAVVFAFALAVAGCVSGGENGDMVELGPTIPEDLEPGEVLYVVMYQDGLEPQTYILHPEASACP